MGGFRNYIWSDYAWTGAREAADDLEPLWCRPHAAFFTLQWGDGSGSRQGGGLESGCFARWGVLLTVPAHPQHPHGLGRR